MNPIDLALERFLANAKGQLEGGLDALLHPDVVFWSPIVFTPQRGIDITKLYLGAAGATLPGEPKPAAGDDRDDKPDGSFRYVRTVKGSHDAVLEFETSIDGKYVNGVDMITCDDDSMITDFKVMIRPLQAINLVHAQMKSALERMTP